MRAAKFFRWAIRAFLAAGLAILSGCGESQSWRQKTILEVETPDGMVSGGSVVEVTFHYFSKLERFGSSSGANLRSRGEASFVEVDKGKYLFALTVFQPADRTMLVFKDLFPPVPRVDSGLLFSRKIKTAREARSIPPEHYPMLATFDDINDPKSVKRVDPDDLDATFGMCPDGSGLKDTDAPWRAHKINWREWARWKLSGEKLDDYLYGRNHNRWPPRWYEQFDSRIAQRDKSGDCRSLKSISIEITGEKVTEGKVETVLGWWCEYRAKYFVERYAKTVSNDFAREVGGSHFRIGDCR